MRFTAILRSAAVVGIALMATAASGNWLATVSKTDGGHVIGNPDAQVTLTEWVSYSCPHCAHFTKQGDPALKLAYIAPGKVKVEIRPIIRNGVDLVATMLVNCGSVDKFPQNHTAFMLAQDDWIPIAVKATKSQMDRWASPDRAAGRRAVADDLKFYDIMERRGYSRAESDRCLADNAAADKILATSEKDWTDNELVGTPAFAINGLVLAGTHSWELLAPQLAARF